MTGRRLTPALAAAGFLAAFAFWLGLFALREARPAQGFDIPRWELTTVANKWLFAAGAPFRDDPSADEAIAAYFALDDREGEDARRLENVVESAIEGRIDAAIRDLDLNFRAPLPGALAVWPPVDMELSGTPTVLVISPRSVIRRDSDRALRVDLTVPELLEIERETEERDDSISALVVRTGGVAVYPSIVSNMESYRGTVSTAAHEWVHHYLAFYPLGQSFFENVDTRTINETVADIVGHELRDVVLDRYGDPAPEVESSATLTVDRSQVLRDLRIEVDALLADGRIEEAEHRMEEVRQFLEDHGVYIRRINQAYFAWFGTYAARDDAVDPLGPQIREIRERAGSLRHFLELVRDTTSRSEVEALLADLQGGEGS